MNSFKPEASLCLLFFFFVSEREREREPDQNILKLKEGKYEDVT